MYPQFVPQPYRRPLNLVLILALLIVIYFIGKKNKWWGKPEQGADTVESNPNDKPVSANFNAENAAVEIAELFSYTDFNDVFVAETSRKDYRAFDKILKHNYNEIRAIHNAWLKKYAGGKYWEGIKDTLRKQVEAEYIDPWRTKTLELKTRVIKRLDHLGL